MINLASLLNEEQDPKAIEKIVPRIEPLLTGTETIEYIAVQKAATIISPDCVVVTNRRVIFCHMKNLGFSMDMKDFLWRDVQDCQVKESILGATFSATSLSGVKSAMDYLPKVQARSLYRLAQEREEEQIEVRRQRAMEEKRAAAGHVVVNQPTSTSQSNNTTAKIMDDPVAVLQKLKSLLQNDLITQGEYDAKKAEILSRM